MTMRHLLVLAFVFAAVPVRAADRMFDVMVKLTRGEKKVAAPRIRVRALEEGTMQLSSRDGTTTFVVKVEPEGTPACQMATVNATEMRVNKEANKRELRASMEVCNGEPKTLNFEPPLGNGDVSLTVAVTPVAESAAT
jgi:hypothetical protein